MTPDPGDIRTWGPVELARHRHRRRLHDLLAATPWYHITVVDGRLMIGPPEVVTPAADYFIRAHRDDLVAHTLFLERRIK